MTRTRPSRRPKLTRAQAARVQAPVRARGLTFEVFLPEGLADWLYAEINAGTFATPAEAAFVAFQDLKALNDHPRARRLLLELRLEAAEATQEPAISIAEWTTQFQEELLLEANTSPPPARELPQALRAHLDRKKRRAGLRV